MRIEELKTPCYVIDEKQLKKNLSILQKVEKDTGCKILLAQKAFSCFYEYPLIGQYLSGTTASGLFEARLGKEEMGKENHVFAPAYKEEDVKELVKICDHMVFNSFSQLEKYKTLCKETSVGIRINPECSTQGDHAIYDPCAKGSRLGVTIAHFKEQFTDEMYDYVDGLHFHTLCEQDADALALTLAAVEDRFGDLLPRMQWLNFGGGHHITRPDYDVERLVRCIERVRDTYGVQVYLEPGEAVALNAGYLVATVLDVVHNGMDIAILDASAACHMPDVLEMPYRPHILYSGTAGEKAYTYRLAGNTCLAGDVIGDYSFDHQLQAGEKLVFCDMAIYSMVKNNTFNGIPLPDIALYQNGHIDLVKRFGYADFEGRLS